MTSLVSFDLGRRSMRSRSTVFARSSRCRSTCPRSRAPRRPCSASSRCAIACCRSCRCARCSACAAARDRDDAARSWSLAMGKSTVGVVADRTREILRVDPACIDAGAGPAHARSRGRGNRVRFAASTSGRRLVAVLSPDRLFRSDLVRRVLSEAGNDNAESDAETAGNAMADEQFIIFRLGDQEYGLPIAAVDEIARPPDQITRLAQGPANSSTASSTSAAAWCRSWIFAGGSTSSRGNRRRPGAFWYWRSAAVRPASWSTASRKC